MLYAQLEGARARHPADRQHRQFRGRRRRGRRRAARRPRRRGSRAGAGPSAGLADALGAHPQPAARAGARPARIRRSNGIVSGIVIEQEQIGPNRYIARLGVLFDRARTGQMLGVSGPDRRARRRCCVIPVMTTGSAAYSFEFRNDWQRAWAQFRTAGSPIDYVRTVGHRHRSAAAQRRPRRGGAGAAGGGCCSTNMARPTSSSPRSSCAASIRAGRRSAIFTARYGPDSQFARPLRAARRRTAPRSRAMLDEGVRRIDGCSTPGARSRACSRPDPTPGHRRSRRCRRARGARPRTPVAEEMASRQRAGRPARRPELQRPGRDPRRRLGRSRPRSR